MIPKVAGKGRSFKGAGLYYLHDKGASTRERVAFTHTENLPTRDPDKAIKCMAYTALRQSEIKARAGGSTKGRKLVDPVYCYSLSWVPGENPSQEEMIGAALESLKVLGLSSHEALFVGHNDEPHPHIHVIVNRVNPETGIAEPLKKDFLKLSSWAEEFERRHGKIHCEQRVENNARRRQGEFVKDRDSQHAAEFHRWRQDRVDRQHDKRAVEAAVLDARQEREREQLRIARDKQITTKREQVRESTRHHWRDLFTIQRQEKQRLVKAQRNAWTRLRFYVRTHGGKWKNASKAERRDIIKGGFSALLGTKAQYRALETKQKADRIFFSKKLKENTNHLIEAIKKEYERKLAELRVKQSKERSDQQAEHSKESQRQAKEIREGRDRQVYDRERRDKRLEELRDTKNDIGQPTGENAAPRKPTLRDQFRRAKGQAVNQTRELDQQKAAPSRVEPKAPSKQTEFREQSKDTTERAEKPSKKTEGLAGKFSKAREENSDARKADKTSAFKENAKDSGMDQGRDRSRTRKPPGHKPD